MKKLLINLTTSDLLDTQVWEHWMEEEIEYVRPTEKKEINEISNHDYLVSTDFVLDNGTKLTGFCTPQDRSGLDYIQPVIITDSNQVIFWKDEGWTNKEKNIELDKLGLNWDEVFPIEYKTLIKCDNNYINGKIEDFNK